VQRGASRRHACARQSRLSVRTAAPKHRLQARMKPVKEGGADIVTSTLRSSISLL
jgi:hypothetical protein